ncbi:MAG: trypsin-like peptidase domain-containing protein [Candidatus Paceibacterota bacterium]
MKIEELNKSQIILLTLLVSFVTSIATGIVTVSLMERAPVGVTQTINRIVERTVERVVPGETKSVTVMTENDQLVAAIDSVSKSLVHITASSTDGIISNGIGFVFGKGVIAGDKTILGESRTYTGGFNNSTSATLSHTSADAIPAALFAIESNSKIIIPAVKIGKVDSLRLGQMVVTVGGDAGTKKISVGVINNIVRDTTATSTPVISITTTIDPNDIVYGSPLVTLSGEVVGIALSTSNIEKTNTFSPITVLGTVLYAQ